VTAAEEVRYAQRAAGQLSDNGFHDEAVLARVLSPENLCRPNDPKVLNNTGATPD
jgi:hypothetical protein